VLVFLPPIVLVFALFPLLLRAVWRTEPLSEGPLRDRLEAVGARWGFRPGKFSSGKPTARSSTPRSPAFCRSCATCSSAMRCCSVFNDEEIEAVFAHEIGHIRYHHLLERGLVMVLPVVLWLTLLAAFPQTIQRLSNVSAGWGVSTAVQTALFVPLAMGIYALAIFGPYSRRLELEADLFACLDADPEGRLTSRGVARFVGALEKLARANGGGKRRFVWLHPTVEQRVDFLHELGPDCPTAALPFQRRLRTIARLAAAVVLGALGYLLVAGSGIS